jgi:tetratricopeptide (TPR) repeat protein
MTRAISLLALVPLAALSARAQDTAAGIEQFHKGQYVEARKTLERALKQSPGDAHAATFLALARAATGGCAEALPELAAQFRTSASELRRLAGVGLAQCHLAESRFDEAYPVIRSLEERDPADADVLYLSAKLHMKAWNGVVLRMFEKTPASYRVNQLSAEILEVQGRFAEAAAEYRKAIAKNPAAVNLHYRLARALLMESHAPEALDAARKEFEAELALNPSDAAAEYQVGQILAAQQREADAAVRFARAAELAPDFGEALLALGKLRAGDEAIALLERAVRLQPANEAARYSLMLAYRKAGRAADALRQKEELDKLQKPPEGEFTEFLKRLGEKPK